MLGLHNRLNGLIIFLLAVSASSFSSWSYQCTTSIHSKNQRHQKFVVRPFSTTHNTPSSSRLNLDSNDESDVSTVLLADSDQLLLGIASTTAGFITLYSEYVLKSTGCGLPAGPFGLVGAAEGVSYLGIVGMGAFSLYQKFKTGSGLPAGPGGILGLGEGLSFLAIVTGLVVFLLQIINFGYIPNAIPMEGGMCS